MKTGRRDDWWKGYEFYFSFLSTNELSFSFLNLIGFLSNGKKKKKVGKWSLQFGEHYLRIIINK